MRYKTDLVARCCHALLLLIAFGANTGEAHGHGQGSVESLLAAHDLSSSHEGPGDGFNNDLARNFHSPRLEYNEWLPVGRGDPLKNDPTYDYSPPVLDRVRYWSEGSKADKTAGNDILLLGVPSKKLSGGAVAGKDWNSLPVRRNYFSHGVASPNQLPTVLMPPPLNSNFLGGPGDGAGFWGSTAVAAATQRVDQQPGEAFKYRPATSFPSQGQYQVSKHPETTVISHPIKAQFHHHHQPLGAPAAFNNRQQQQPAQQQQQQQQPYFTTIRLTTPAGETAKRPLLKTILQNEHSYPFTKTSMTSTLTEYTSGGFYDAQNINAMAQTIFHPPQTTEYLQNQPTKVAPKLSTAVRAPFVTPAGPYVTPVSTPVTTSTTTTMRSTIVPSSGGWIYQHGNAAVPSMIPPVMTSTPVPTTTTTTTTTTTEASFSQYKEPVAAPERWSPYLIIEGHSKVKTYGLNTNDTLMQLPRMVPVASTKDPIVRHVVNRDPATGAELGVTHNATRRPPVYEVTRPRTPAVEAPAKASQQDSGESAVDTLLSLLDTGSFGDMLKDDGEAVGNSLDGEAGRKDSKTRRNVRVVRQH